MLSLFLFLMLTKVPLPVPDAINPGETYGCSASEIKPQIGVMPGWLVYAWVGVKAFVLHGPAADEPRWVKRLSTRPYDSVNDKDHARRMAFKDCDEWLRSVDKQVLQKKK